MKKVLVGLLLSVFTTLSWAQDRDKVLDRVSEAGTVMNEIMAAPDKGIPEDILGSSQCVAVVPSMLKGGFIVGASYGKGVASCKTSSGWSAPAFFRVEGGSFGFQIGGQAVDLVMVIMNERGMRALLSSKFKLGADASVAAGPVGRHAEGATAWKMRAQVLESDRTHCGCACAGIDPGAGGVGAARVVFLRDFRGCNRRPYVRAAARRRHRVDRRHRRHRARPICAL